MTPEEEFDGKVRAFQTQLVQGLLDQCTTDQQELFKKMYPNGPRDKQFRQAYGQCSRTIAKNRRMEYNVCETCGAGDGRAGDLFSVGDDPKECLNCYKTRNTGEVSICTNLKRTETEIARTIAILEEPK